MSKIKIYLNRFVRKKFREQPGQVAYGCYAPHEYEHKHERTSTRARTRSPWMVIRNRAVTPIEPGFIERFDLFNPIQHSVGYASIFPFFGGLLIPRKGLEGNDAPRWVPRAERKRRNFQRCPVSLYPGFPSRVLGNRTNTTGTIIVFR